MKINVFDLLQKRYPISEYALMAEVRDKAGFSASRSADYIAVNLWPSRGLSVNGIELKSFRSDWLSELKKPQKAENIFQYCDYFWLLTTDDTIAKIEEIPESWGWLCIKGEKIFTKKEAPKLAPIPISRHFFAAALKRAVDKTQYIHIDSIDDKIQEARNIVEVKHKNNIEHLEKEILELKSILVNFKQASGIDLTGYYRWQTNPIKIGHAVKFIENGGTDTIKRQLFELENTAKSVLENITNGIKHLSEPLN